jgi:hypothetical protein
VAVVRVELPKTLPAEVVLPAAAEVLVNKKKTLPKGVTRLTTTDGTLRFRLEQVEKVLFELRER